MPEPTFYQKERLESLATEMNSQAQRRYSMKGQLFVTPADWRGNDPVIGPGSNYQGNEGIFSEIMEAYQHQIGMAMSRINPFKDVSEQTIGLVLWTTDGVFRYDGKNHFTLANGTKSPVYFNMRVLSKRPNAMNLITGFFQTECEYTCEKPDVLVGGEAAGIPFATWWAESTHTRLAVARKPKTHGIPSKVDGDIYKGDVGFLVEDLITDGGSKIPFMNGIRESGGEVSDVFVVFDREQGGREKLSELGANLHSLIGVRNFLQVGEKGRRIDAEALEDINRYFEDSEKWNRDHGYEWNPTSKE